MKKHQYTAGLCVFNFILAAIDAGAGAYGLSRGQAYGAFMIGSAVFFFGLGLLWMATFAVYLWKAEA